MTVALAASMHYWLAVVAVHGVAVAIVALYHTLGVDSAATAAVATDVSRAVV
jgi:hypothetical protein